MATTKISALSAASAAAAANEFAINEAGTSKKISGTQLLAYLQTLGFPKVAKMTGIQQSTSTTLTKVTDLDMALEVGVWCFDYRLQCRTTVGATVFRLATNFSGTADRFLVEATGFESLSGGSGGQLTVSEPGFGLRSGGQNNAPSATTVVFGPTSINVADSDVQVCVRGLLAVTGTGNLELYFSSETAASGTQSIEAASSLVCIRTA